MKKYVPIFCIILILFASAACSSGTRKEAPVTEPPASSIVTSDAQTTPCVSSAETSESTTRETTTVPPTAAVVTTELPTTSGTVTTLPVTTKAVTTTAVTTTSSVHTHQFTDYSFTKHYTCEGKEIWTAMCTCKEIKNEYREQKPVLGMTSLDGKKILFIGNSFIYYGNCVINGGQGKEDKGYFYQVCKANGDDVTVIDCVYGGHRLYDYAGVCKTCREKDSSKQVDHLASLDFSSFDYVILSEAGENNASIMTDLANVMKRFTNPKTNFVYLCHSYSYDKNHTNITGNLSIMQKKNITVINWGNLVTDIWNKKVSVPGAELTYNKNSFIVNKKDTYHPNPLSGYITALMTYCGITGKSAVGQSYSFVNDASINATWCNFPTYQSNYYNAGTTNFAEIFQSGKDMAGIQKLIDQYNEKWSATGAGADLQYGEHDWKVTGKILYHGTKDEFDDVEAVCTYCAQKTVLHENPTGADRKNVMYVSDKTVKAAGYSTVKELMLAGKSHVAYQTVNGWGRAGFKSIQGMASLSDGNRAMKIAQDASVLYWKISSASARYDENGVSKSDGKYLALIGYDFTESHTVDGFTIFTDRSGHAPTGFDVLGGKKNADGTITWTVLWSSDGKSLDYQTYDDLTKYLSADFAKTEIDCLEIGVTSLSGTEFYISELEVYGQ